MQFEGNWAPVTDIMVDKVGKFACAVACPTAEPVAMPVLLDVVLDVSVKVRVMAFYEYRLCLGGQ